MTRLARLTVAVAASLSLPVCAQSSVQTPAQALADRLIDICEGAVHGSQLAQRCSDIFNSTDPQAFLRAAIGQRLDEIPGQARVATREAMQAMRRATFVEPGSDGASLALRSEFMPLLNADGDGSLAASWSVFFSADAGWLDRRSSPNEAAFKADTGSLTAGIDWQLGPDWMLGLALNHVREDLDFSASDGEASTRFSGVFATGSRTLGDTWSVAGYLGAFNGEYDLTRAIAYTLPSSAGPVSFSAEARANPDARRRVSGLSLDGRWARDGWDWGLAAGLDNSRTTIDAYGETGGGGLALNVPERSISTRRGRLDFSVGRTLSHSRGVFQPSLRLGWRQEFGNPRRALTVRLAEDGLGSGITFDTEDPDKSWGEIAVGGVMTFTGGHSGFFELRQRVAHAFLQERMLAIGWRIEL